MLPVVCLLLPAAPIPAPKADPAKDDLQRMQGAWAVARVERGGKDVTADSPETGVVIRGARCNFTSSRSGVSTLLKLDARPGPRHFTIGGDKLVLARGIYELDGDTLTLSYFVDGRDTGKRPGGPATTSDRHVTLTLKRQKPAPPTKRRVRAPE